MSHVRLALAPAVALVALAALTACSSSSDAPDSASNGEGGSKQVASPAPKPITKDLTQADLTKAVLGDGETLPRYTVQDHVDGYSRSGKTVIRVQIDGNTGGDPSGARAMLSATLKRLQQLQQLQDGKPATVTAAEEQAAAEK
ncbi:hypothetical protein [Streptomyces sp. NPDC058308]|uniref:hypothetical protein n=1 Tax=Streptomyces sp. NPDC058308 TaxID=3346440 RepID=UPI0036E4FE64